MFVLLAAILVVGITVGASADPVLIPADAVSRQGIDELDIPALPLLAGWRYHTGHAEAWAARDFDDSGWLILDSLDTMLSEQTRERIGWQGEGWFRLRLRLDPDMPVGTMGLLYGHKGGIAVYFDGQLLDTSGRVSSRQTEEQVYLVGELKEVVPLPLEPGGEHVIAMHYSNRNTLAMFDPPEPPGIIAALVDVSAYEGLARWLIYSHVQQQTLFVVPLAFGIFHLLLYLYHRQQSGHLYYAIFALSVAVLIYAPLHLAFLHEPRDFTLLRLTFKWSLLVVPLSGLLFLYTEFLERPSKLFWALCAIGAVVGALALVLPLDIIYYVCLLFLVDVVRVVVLGLSRGAPGAGIVRAGWFLFASGCLLQVLMELDVFEFPIEFFPYIYGTLLLVVSMSVYLARGVARTNHQLAEQLTQVRDLSARAVEHEREVQSAKLSTLTHLVAGIVHEMNSPVGTIRSARDTLSRAIGKLRGDIPPGAALQAIDSSNVAIESATDRLGTVLSGFKSFSHLDEAEWQIARIEQGLDSTVAVMDSQLGGDIDVERQYGELPAIWCAPARLNQVFMHLITNALQALDGGAGTIRLRTWVEDEQACVSVGDSGPGIPAEHLEGLFDVAFRQKARVKMGMGLVADVNTVNEHGGQMQVHSEVGVGTEVIIRLPLRLHE
jgi:signal transduction histidine kinase